MDRKKMIISRDNLIPYKIMEDGYYRKIKTWQLKIHVKNNMKILTIRIRFA